ncbi:MAG: transposase [Nanoarchaeota archaeon]|nr:transposase [Nanoarchaeota archaeon]
MKKRLTLKDKAYHLWKQAGLPDFFNRKGPKRTPAWKTYLAYLEYTNHAPSYRRAANFMVDYHHERRHWTTWQKAIAKWPFWVWDALADVSVEDEPCEIAAIDGTTLARSNPSQHYLRRIGAEGRVSRPVQGVLLVDVERRKFLAWRVRATPRGEKCDVPYLFGRCPNSVDLVLMDKGFDSEPLHEWLRDHGVWSIAPTRKGCKRGRYRKQLRDCFDHALYWQRNIVESLISAVKRLYGVHLRARSWRAQRAEVYARLISYNIGAKIKHYFLLSHLRGKIYK